MRGVRTMNDDTHVLPWNDDSDDREIVGVKYLVEIEDDTQTPAEPGRMNDARSI